MLHLQDQPILILGLGASGLAMARWCTRHGARVTVADTREAPPQLAVLWSELPEATFIGGPFGAELVEGGVVRAVYRSPGLSPAATAVVVDAARALGLPVGGELDLFARALRDLRGEDPVPQAPETAPAQAELAPLPLCAQAAAAPTYAPDAPDTAETPDLPEGASGAEDDASEVDAEADAPAAAVPEDDDDMAAPVPDTVEPPPAPAGYRPAVLAITGTNGKTTVTSLTGQLVERTGRTYAVAGNIGPTLLDTLSAHMDTNTLPEVWVLELSSFQLDGVSGFEPTAAAVLNLTQDHLDWHGDMRAYGAAKARIFGQHGLMVLNREDPAVMAMLPAPVKVKLQRPQARPHVTFGGDMPQRPGDFGIENVNGMAWLVRALEADETRKRRRDAEEEIHIQRLMPADALRIHGRHNAVNALAALALAQAAGCPLGPMLFGLREYRGEPHRVESVAVIGGVEYFDDSKGTNVGATVAALQGLGAERRVVVILGGDGKGQDFSPLAAPVARHVRAVVLIGRDAGLLREVLVGTGVPLEDADTLPAAVNTAGRMAHVGDAVLLSPACASFDMFDGYEHRAQVFCETVNALAEEAAFAGGEGA